MLNANFNTISFLVISFFISLADLASEILAPTLSEINERFAYLNITVHQYVMGIFSLGYAVGTIFFGILTDKIGRRKVLVAGATIFFISNLICYLFFNNLFLFLFGRFLQGIGSATAILIGYSSLRDAYNGDIYSKMISKMDFFISIFPIVAPLIGLLFLSSTHGIEYIFLFLLICSATCLYFIFIKFKDTLNKADYAEGGFFILLKSYFILFIDKNFMKYAMIKAFISAFLWGDTANFPLVVMTGLNESFSNYAIFIVMHLFWCLIGIFINYHCVTKYGTKKMLSFGLSLEVISELCLVFICYYFNINSVISYGFLISISDIALTLILANASSMATLHLPRNKIGRANAVISFLNSVFTMIFIMLAAYFFNGTFVPTIIMASFCAIISYLIFKF